MCQPCRCASVLCVTAMMMDKSVKQAITRLVPAVPCLKAIMLLKKHPHHAMVLGVLNVPAMPCLTALINANSRKERSRTRCVPWCWRCHVFMPFVALANICIVPYVPAVPFVAALMIAQSVEEANTRILPLCRPCRKYQSGRV